MSIDRDELPEPFMEPTSPTPGVGRVAVPVGSVGPEDHFRGFSLAFHRAMLNIGRAPGDYHVELKLTATVHVENPGAVIEYVATIS